MNRYAIVNIVTHKVENIAEWDGVTEWNPGHEKVAVPAGDATIDWDWDETTNALTPPPPVAI